MKTLIILSMVLFANIGSATWTPSAEEIQLSAKEDAREAALFKLLAVK